MAENCQQAIWECQAQGGLLIDCYEHPEGVEYNCELPPPAPWQEPAPAPAPPPGYPPIPPPIPQPQPQPGQPPAAEKASMVPWVIGAGVLGVGAYFLFR